MKKYLALFATVLAAVLNAATPSTSLVYVDTTARTLTGNIVAGNNTTISASGNGTITATAAPLSGITGLGSGVGTFLATPSSANLASAVTNETGSGALVFATSPTLVTPDIGAAIGTSVNMSGAGTFGGNLTVNGTTISLGGAAGSWDLNAIQVLRGSIYGAGNETGYYSNANYSGGWKYMASAAASGYLQNGGTHQWYTASSGTAGTAISFTQQMSLNNSGSLSLAGNLSVSGTGLSAISGNLNVAGVGTFNKSLDSITTESDYAIRIKTSNDDGGLYLGANSGISVIQAIDPGTTFDRKLSIQPNGGNVLIGTASDAGAKLTVSKGNGGNTNGAANAAIYLPVDESNIQGSGTNTIIRMGGNILLGGNNSLFLTTNGTTALGFNSSQALRLYAYGAGTLTTDSSGNVTATSDERAKNITGTFTKGLAEVVKLTPKTYTWKEETGLNTTDVVASLTAQDLIAAGIPEAVNTYRTVADVDEDGNQKVDGDGKPLTKRVDATYTVSDRAVIAALVNAVKELKAEVDALKAARN